MADYVMTIGSDSEEVPSYANRGAKQHLEDAQLDLELVFDLSGDPYIDILEQHSDLRDLVEKGTKPEPISVDDIIARRRVNSKRKRQVADVDVDYSEGGSEEHTTDQGDEEHEEEEDPMVTSADGESETDIEGDDGEEADAASAYAESSSDESDKETQAEKDRKAAYFAIGPEDTKSHESFLSMNLSRPLLKAISNLGFQKPTPIQAAAIPVALLGKDIVGNAVTGSGKTAAFIIPVLERLLYREKGKRAAATRCLILGPTRELAVQCFDVGRKLAAHTDVAFCLVAGGLSLKSQETALRARPDVVVATPGRLIDHIRNSPSFSLDALDILILDEADRMLSDGFSDELTEIIKSCPTSRQTMLFSATMTDSVDELVKMSLNKPVRLFVDPKRTTARGLVQEFVRVRAGREGDRSALLVALCRRTFKNKVIVFLRSKKLAHQMRIVFSILGLKCEELHGDLTQEQRLKALQVFRDGSVDFLMATDLASRGLDIKGVETIINYDMPAQLSQYMHRVGRTARAGTKGRSVTLVGEGDRKMLKAAIRHSVGEDHIRHRTIPAEVVQKWIERLEAMKPEIQEVLKEEKEEKQLRKAEMELKKGQNIIEHEAEIYSRPARTWFQTQKEKAKSQALSKQSYEANFNEGRKDKNAKADTRKPKRDKMAGLSRKAKRRKMAMEEDKEMGADPGIMNAAIRLAKKSARPKKIAVSVSKSGGGFQRANKNTVQAKSKSGSAHKRSVFERDLSKKGPSLEGIRAIKSDTTGTRKKGGKRKGKGR